MPRSRIILLLIATLALGSNAVSAEQSVRLMASTSPPYVDAQLPEQGLALELVRHIYSRTGYTPDIKIERWSQAVEGTQIGVYDALAVAWYTEERNKDFIFSEPYLDGDLILVKALHDPRNYRGLQDLSGKRLGVQTDYGYGIDFEQIQGLVLVQENHLIQNLLKLLQGKLDLVIGDRRTLKMQLHEYLSDRANQVQVVPMSLPSRERHVAASREVAGSQDMIAAFNKALTEVKKDGSYDAIISKWEERYGMATN